MGPPAGLGPLATTSTTPPGLKSKWMVTGPARGVLAGVGERLLGGPIQGQAGVGTDATGPALHGQVGSGPGGQRGELLGQLDRLVAQGVHRLAGFL